MRSELSFRRLIFTGHAVTQMFARAISDKDVRSMLAEGEIIAQYDDDQPYPSFLLMSFVNTRPLHLVVGYDEAAQTIYVITAYEPDPALWENDFRTRRLS